MAFFYKCLWARNLSWSGQEFCTHVGPQSVELMRPKILASCSLGSHCDDEGRSLLNTDTPWLSISSPPLLWLSPNIQNHEQRFWNLASSVKVLILCGGYELLLFTWNWCLLDSWNSSPWWQGQVENAEVRNRSTETEVRKPKCGIEKKSRLSVSSPLLTHVKAL